MSVSVFGNGKNSNPAITPDNKTRFGIFCFGFQTGCQSPISQAACQHAITIQTTPSSLTISFRRGDCENSPRTT